MTEKEREHQEKLEKEKENEELRNYKMRTDFLQSNNVPIEDWDFIHGEDQDRMFESLERLKARDERIKKEALANFRATETGKPTGSGVEAPISDNIDPSDKNAVNAKFKQIEKEKGRDQALKWLDQIMNK